MSIVLFFLSMHTEPWNNSQTHTLEIASSVSPHDETKSKLKQVHPYQGIRNFYTWFCTVKTAIELVYLSCLSEILRYQFEMYHLNVLYWFYFQIYIQDFYYLYQRYTACKYYKMWPQMPGISFWKVKRRGNGIWVVGVVQGANYATPRKLSTFLLFVGVLYMRWNIRSVVFSLHSSPPPDSRFPDCQQKSARDVTTRVRPVSPPTVPTPSLRLCPEASPKGWMERGPRVQKCPSLKHRRDSRAYIVDPIQPSGGGGWWEGPAQERKCLRNILNVYIHIKYTL